MGKWGYCFTLLIVLIACSTITFHGLRPIYPDIGETVSSLQPVLRWERAKEPNASYDLIIYDGEERIVYSVNNLKENQHKVKSPLKPNTKYFWSIRIRYNGKVGDWSNYEERTESVVVGKVKKNIPFSFYTPSLK